MPSPLPTSQFIQYCQCHVLSKIKVFHYYDNEAHPVLCQKFLTQGTEHNLIS